MKKYIPFILLVVVIVGVILLWRIDEKEGPITSTSTPQVTTSGSTDLIQVTFPTEGTAISSTSPLIVTGKARGTWYFEASFPIYIVNWDGLIIGEGYAEAQSEWMTEDYVPFKGTITFTKPDYGTRGAVIFKKDNPSGDSIRDDALEISIVFK